MKLRGESGGMPARSSGGIVGKGGSSVSPVYKESIPPASVKVVPARSQGVNRLQNSLKSWELQQRKSGRMAQAEANIASHQTGKPSRTIKIKSNNL